MEFELKHLAVVSAVIVVGLVFVLGWTANQAPLDCKKDADCFKAKAANCEPSKVTVSDKGVSSQINILGKENGACSVNLKIMTVKLEESEIALYPQTIRETFIGFAGKEMTCKLPLGSVSTDFLNLTGVCQGSFVEQSKVFSPLMKDYFARLLPINPDCTPRVLWNFTETSYAVYGLQEKENQDSCKTVYSIRLPGKTGFLTIENYELSENTSTGQQQENVDINYEGLVIPSLDFQVWCQHDGWNKSNANGTALAMSLSLEDFENKTYCHASFIIDPRGKLSSALIDVLIAPNGLTSAIVKTDKGIYQKIYS